MNQINNAESELSNFLNEIANQELATWNQPRSSTSLSDFVNKLLDRDPLENINLF